MKLGTFRLQQMHAYATISITLPLNVTYIDEGKDYTKTLAKRDIQAKHSSKLSTQLVKNVLQDYGIQKDHALCIVTDNASNMVSMVEKLNERPREGSNTSEESAAEIQEQSEASHSSQLIICDDLTIINLYE